MLCVITCVQLFNNQPIYIFQYKITNWVSQCVTSQNNAHIRNKYIIMRKYYENIMMRI